MPIDDTLDTSVVIASASYAKDLDRFVLLRRSIEKFAPNILHKVAVHTEDIHIFERELKFSKRLELIPTDEILSTALENSRKRSVQLGRFAREISKLIFPFGRFNGYFAQQISKFEIALRCQSRFVIIMDADTIFSSEICPGNVLSTFLASDKSICFSEPCDSDLHKIWNDNALKLLGLPPLPSGAASTNSIVMPFLVMPKIVRAMAEYLECSYGMLWQLAFARYKAFSEFLIYEKFCRHVLQNDEIEFLKQPEFWTKSIWNFKNINELSKILKSDLMHKYQFFHLQSNFEGFDYKKGLALISDYLDGRTC